MITLLNVTITRILCGIAGISCVRCGHDRDFVLALGCSGYEHLSRAALFAKLVGTHQIIKLSRGFVLPANEVLQCLKQCSVC